MLSELTPTRADVHAQQDATGLRAPIIQAIRRFASNAPRSLQRAVGPSQVGTPCARELMYQVSDIEPARDLNDPWPSIVGTAVHTWLADCMAAANPPPPAPPVWLPETRVDVGFGLKGSSDIIYVPTGTVIDWKILGDTQYRKCIADGPSEKYKTQAHCYGLGFLRAGFRVNTVAIAFFGRAKGLKDLRIWSEPFDVNIALRALDRLRTVQRLRAAGVHPLRIPETPGGSCFFCSYRGKESDGFCEGAKKEGP